MSAATTMKTKHTRRAAKQVAEDEVSKLDVLTDNIQPTQAGREVSLIKVAKRKVTAKKVLTEEDANHLTNLSDSDGTNGTTIAATGEPAQTYAQNASVSSDATGSSATPSDLSVSESTSIESVAVGTGSGLSTMQMVGLGLLGVAAAGGITAIAISSSRTSSNNTAPSSTPDTTAPEIQSLSAHSSTRTIELVYNEALDPSHLPLASAFTVSTGGAANPVTGVTVNGNVMTLTLTNPFSAGALTIGYTDPTTGNDVNAIQDISGNDASGFLQGIVADGYISGAEIFLDINGNGIADVGESTGIFTQEDGSFFLPSTLPNAAIIAVGGVNIDTNLEQLTPLRAPPGSTTINPLTTLVQAVIDRAAQIGNPISVEAAATQVANSLGITVPAGLTLTSFDPLAGSDAISVNAQKAAAQIATMVGLAAGDNASTASTIMLNLAEVLLDTTDNILDLGNLSAFDLNTLLSGTNTSTEILGEILTASRAINAAEDIVSISNTQKVVLDNLAPSAPRITNVSNTEDYRPTFTGSAEAGANVSLYDSSTLVGSGVANDSGTWSITTNTLVSGDRSITAKATDAAGNTSSESTAFTFTLDDITRPSFITIETVYDDVGDSKGNITPDNTTTDDDRPTFTGRTEANATVRLYDDDSSLVGSAISNSNGDWRITTRSLSNGSHNITAKATDAAGNTSEPSSAFNVTVDSAVHTGSDLLALSGGGYKAMVADAAMFAGVMKYFNNDSDVNNNINVASLLNDNIDISANSGSTWFVNLLAYSPSFVNSLNDYDNLFDKDSDFDTATAYSTAEDYPAHTSVDGFFGVMGEQYNNYVNRYIDAATGAIKNTFRTEITAVINGIQSFSDLVALLDNSTGNLGKFILAGLSDGGQYVLGLLDTVATNLDFLGLYGSVKSGLEKLFADSTDLQQYLGVASVALLEGIDWNVFAQRAIFAPDRTDLLLKDINFYTSLSSDEGTTTKRNSAVATQSLIYELVISADEAAIAPKSNAIGADVVKVSVTNSEAGYGLFNAFTYNFIPASATSLGSSTDIPAPWLPSIMSGDLSVEYDAGLWDWGRDKTFTDLDFKGLSAFLSSTISSSAGALGGSYGVLADTTSVAGALVNLLDVATAGNFSDIILDYTKGLAPLVKVTRNADGSYTAGDPTYTSATNFIDPIETTSSANAASQGYLRMGDGGYFDNSSVTSGLSYIYANNYSSWVANDGIEDFDITLFVFSGIGETISQTLGDRGFDNIGNVAERLFKDGKQQAVKVAGIDILDLSHPNSAIFESAVGSVYGMDEPIWTYSDPLSEDAYNPITDSRYGFEIKAYDMDVITMANNTMNIGAGYEGSLRLWNIISSTGAIPLQTMGTWNDYELMYEQIIAGLQTENNGYTGAALLAHHIGAQTIGGDAVLLA
jgi:hypothetical protein